MKTDHDNWCIKSRSDVALVCLIKMCQTTSCSFKDQGNAEYKKGNWLKAAGLYTKVGAMRAGDR